MKRALLLALTLLCVGAATPAQAELKAIWGPNALHDGTPAFPIYERLGVDVLQKQVVWSSVAKRRPADPRNPDDPAYVWPAEVDEVYAANRQYGFQLALMVRGTPSWANGGRTPAWRPDDAGDYADFMVAAARRYARVKYWMVWGEPTRSQNFQPLPRNHPAGPRAYALLLDRAYGALKKERKSIRVIGGMTFHYAELMPTDWVRWMRLPNGKPPRLDLFGHNPFTGRRPDLRKKPFIRKQRDFSDIDTYVREIRRHWRPRKVKPKLWLSEFCVASDRANHAFAFHVSRKTQASWLSAAFRITHRTPYVKAMGWYELQDDAPDDGVTCGLLDREGNPKPSYTAYRKAR